MKLRVTTMTTKSVERNMRIRGLCEGCSIGIRGSCEGIMHVSWMSSEVYII